MPKDMSQSEPTAPPLDAAWHSAIGRVTGGLSPAALSTAALDWGLHLLASPQKQMELGALALSDWQGLWRRSDPTSAASDKRFRDPAWNGPPYDLYRDSFLMAQHLWHQATTDLRGVDPKHLQIMNFVARQALDTVAPSNSPLTNPQVIETTREEMGQNLMRGASYWLEDFNRLVTRDRHRDPNFKVGETVAVTPGEVVMRNDLMELIRYHPTTKRVQAEPILIVPAWIMKYYVLDLSPHNSLVKYLRDQGFEVFILSWKNPDGEDADLGMDDYIDLGARAAVQKIKSMGSDHIHAVGYCLGGTLLAITAAAMARDDDQTLRSISLLASQVDFSRPGELGLFINESQVAFLEDLMATQGYLRADQMAGAFQMLRSNDLIWSRVIRHYLLGERTPMNDLMAWNADTTRMPAKMHFEYLRQLFLNNDLAKGQYKVDGKSVALTDIRAPIFSLATEHDHISPWKSVYRVGLLSDTDVTFVLTNGGHNGGVLSEPGHKRRHYRIREMHAHGRHRAAVDWFENTEIHDGSWWPIWSDWLKARSSKTLRAPEPAGKGLDAAPGRYVYL